MIAHLRGVILDKHPNQVIVEAGGVGYDVAISVATYAALPDKGAEVRLHIHTHVREDTLALYGFLTADEKMLFERLITVSGVGPKLAVTVLSGFPADELIAAIGGGAVDQLVRIPGIGKKTAERIVLELREKLPPAAEAAPPSARPALSTLERDVLSALVNLGCAPAAAEAAVRKAKAQVSGEAFEPLFRRALELVR